jgi:hypothetical protein
MKLIWRTMGDIMRNFREKFFLKKHTPEQYTLDILQMLYPSVDWRRVDFYEGLPWFTPMVAPYVTAQALPQFYSFSKYRIYLKKFDESRPQCLADIVHEGFHIMQAMHFMKGYGIGFLRGLMVYYNALYATHGYRSNPFEEPAYDQEFRFLDHCSKAGLHGIASDVHSEKLKESLHASPLVFEGYQFKYAGNIFALAGSFVMCLGIAVVKPVVDLFMMISGGVYAGYRALSKS